MKKFKSFFSWFSLIVVMLYSGLNIIASIIYLFSTTDIVEYLKGNRKMNVIKDSINNKNIEKFGKIEETSALLVYIRELDNRRKVSKDIIAHLEELVNKSDNEGRPLNSIRL